VRDDVIEQRSVSAEAARESTAWSSPRGHVDAPATAKLRAGRREANRRKDGAADKLPGEVVMRVTDNLDVRATAAAACGLREVRR